MKTNTKILFGAVGAAFLLAHLAKRKANGIGAVKRRIYKELSLAQKAGVDFTKKYDELSEDEIVALQQVGADTGYTETYYKSLKKAYDAISGIGAAYDVRDADGNVCLTWVEDPQDQADDADHWNALQEAHTIDDERQYALDSAAREIEEKRRRTEEAEARAAESRKRLRKTRRDSENMIRRGMSILSDGITMGEHQPGEQMALFGVSELSRARDAALFDIWREQLDYGDTDLDFDVWRRTIGKEIAQTPAFRLLL